MIVRVAPVVKAKTSMSGLDFELEVKAPSSTSIKDLMGTPSFEASNSPRKRITAKERKESMRQLARESSALRPNGRTNEKESSGS